MSTFDDNVQITVVADAAPVGRAGFGVMMVAGPCSMSERLRYYTTAAGAAADVTAGEISAAQGAAVAAGFAQQPKPARIAVGRTDADVAQVNTVTVGGTIANGQIYTITINGTPFAYTAVVPTDDNDAVATALRSAINGGSEPVTASGAGAAVVLTADVAGTPFDVLTSATGTGTLVDVATTPNVNIATSLAAIVAEQSEWYGLVTISRVELQILRAAEWIESNNRIYLAQTADAGVIAATTTDIAAQLDALSYNRTAVLYHDAAQYADAAWMAKTLAADLDTQTTIWAQKTLAGITITTGLSETQKGNVTGKNANLYLSMGGVGATGQGTMASGRFMDIQTTIDWLVSRVREAIMQLLLNESNANRKVPYSDEGFAQIESVVRGVLTRSLRAGHLIVSPDDGIPPFIDMPARVDVDPADAAARLLRFSFGGLLAGAVQMVIGSGSVTTDVNTFNLLAGTVEV